MPAQGAALEVPGKRPSSDGCIGGIDSILHPKPRPRIDRCGDVIDTSRWAQRYIERFNFALTWSPPGEKGPRHAGWNRLEKAIRDPLSAASFWRGHPDHGIGVLLGFSNIVTVDIDHVDHSREIFKTLRVDLDELAANAPKIVGNPDKYRLMFRAPQGIALKHRTLLWPRPEDPRKGLAVFELRAGPVSDALPPSRHTTTRQPYRWANAPTAGFPMLPVAIQEIWTDWANTERKAREVCPWAVPLEQPRPPRHTKSYAGPSVIDAFNAAHDITSILEESGYVRKGKRFLKPDGRHAPGLVLLENGRVYSHHAGDRLGGGHSRDAFDVWTTLIHNGDIRAATREAAKLLGMGVRR